MYDAAPDSGEISGPQGKGKEKEKEVDTYRATDQARADEDEADAIREAIIASRNSYALNLSAFRELSVEPIPSGSQGIPAQHVDPGSGATTRGTFVPNGPATPSQRHRDTGTWVFVPSPGPLLLQPAFSANRTPRHSGRAGQQSMPSNAQSSGSKGKGSARR